MNRKTLLKPAAIVCTLSLAIVGLNYYRDSKDRQFEIARRQKLSLLIRKQQKILTMLNELDLRFLYSREKTFPEDFFQEIEPVEGVIGELKETGEDIETTALLDDTLRKYTLAVEWWRCESEYGDDRTRCQSYLLQTTLDTAQGWLRGSIRKTIDFRDYLLSPLNGIYIRDALIEGARLQKETIVDRIDENISDFKKEREYL
jgi:hypothetical protein